MCSASMSIDWGRLEKVVERAVRKARSEELKDIAEAIKTLADYVKKGFDIIEERSKIIAEHSKRIEEHSKKIEEHSKRIEELTKEVGKQSAVLRSIGRRWGKDLEKSVLELYRHVLEERDIIPEKIEKFTYIDTDGRYYVKGSRIKFDIYLHNERIYLVEVKSHADVEDVEWLYKRAEIYEKIRGKKPDKLLLIAVHIDEDAYERAKDLGVEVIYGAIIP